MTVTVQSFRRDYTEFLDASLYPDADVAFNLALATRFLNQARWGAPGTNTDLANYSEWDFGAELFIAHNLSLSALDKAQAANGAPPGRLAGAIASNSVDKVSVNYDLSSTLDEGAGHWNLTVYGKKFIRLARMMGAGAVMVGANPQCDPLSSQNAWGGPWTANYPNPSGS